MSRHVARRHITIDFNQCNFFAKFDFFFNETATTEIYTLSLHDALPICSSCGSARRGFGTETARSARATRSFRSRSEEHTSELQSHSDLVCRLLLEKKKPTVSA